MFTTDSELATLNAALSSSQIVWKTKARRTGGEWKKPRGERPDKTKTSGLWPHFVPRRIPSKPFLTLMMRYIWESSRHLWSSINHYLSVSLCACHPLLCSALLPLAPVTPASHKEAADYLLVGHCPEANEEEEATLTDIIITVLLGSARGPFCGVITVLSSTHHRIRHYFTHLQHPFVSLDPFFFFLLHRNRNFFLYPLSKAPISSFAPSPDWLCLLQYFSARSQM